jgi:DNA-damage-inducible protein I
LTVQKKLPAGAIEALERELLRRLSIEDAGREYAVKVALRGQDGLLISGATPEEKRRVEELLQETWESADDWFF